MLLCITMNIKIYKDQIIPVKELENIAKEFYYPMIKGVIDIESETIAFGGEYHMDANMFLIESLGLSQEHIWGFNIHLNLPKDSWIEYTSLINIRPTKGNMSMCIDDEYVKEKIKNILDKKIKI